MIEQYDIDPTDDDLEVEPLLEHAKKIARTNTNIRKFEHPQKEVKKYNELDISAAVYRKDALKNKTKIPDPIALPASNTTSNTAKEVITVDNLADIIRQLNINIVKTISQNNKTAPARQNSSYRTAPNAYDRGNLKCYYCQEPGHIKPLCSKLEQNKQDGRCHLGLDNVLYVGRAGERDQKI